MLLAGGGNFRICQTGDWQAWADHVILTMSTPPPWILDLAIAKDAEQVRLAIKDRLVLAEWDATRTLGDSIVGYLWLRFKRGELSLEDCLNLASEYDEDSYCPLLGRLDAGEARTQINVEAETKLAPLGDLARSEWEVLTRIRTV